MSEPPRRATRAPDLVVIQPLREWTCYERQGVLVEEEALASAERQCLADAEVRARRRERDAARRAAEDVDLAERLAEKIAELFPGCPAARARAIAHHAAVRGSGRVGRSAAGRALDDHAVTLAVVASVRHEDTRYDELLMAGVERGEARERVGDVVDRVLERWSRG